MTMRKPYLMPLLAIVTSWYHVTDGYSAGPPAGACDAMTPSHSTNSPSTAAIPYTIATSAASYAANAQLTGCCQYPRSLCPCSGFGTDTTGVRNQICLQNITITGTGATTFKGFFVQARTNTADSATKIGTFTTDGTTLDPCSGGAIAHSETSAKSTKVLTWTAPSSNMGDVTFVATVVQQFDTFWTSLTSSAVTGTGATAATTTTVSTTTTTAGTTGQVTKPGECGTSLGCYSYCDSVCTFVFTWNDGGGDSIDLTLTIQLSASGDKYGAIGLSTDTTMGDDSVMACIHDATGNTVSTSSSYNSGRSNDKLDTSGLTLTSSSYESGVLTCSFSRKKTAALATGSRRKRAATSASNYFDMNSDYYLFLVSGPASSGSLAYHTSTPLISDVQADFQSFQDIGAVSPDKSLIKAHGILMVMAWIFMTSIGTVIANYYKTVWTDKTNVLEQKLWFQLHRGLMVGTLLFTVIAFIIIFVHVKGYSKDITGTGFQKAHPPFGILVLILTFANPIMALFRPKPDSPKRIIFNIAHLAVGSITHLFAILNLFSGVSLTSAAISNNVTTVLYVYIGWEIALLLFLEPYKCYKATKAKKESKTKIEPDATSRSTTSARSSRKETRQFQADDTETPSGLDRYVTDKLLFGILIVHVVMITALMIATAVLIGQS